MEKVSALGLSIALGRLPTSLKTSSITVGPRRGAPVSAGRPLAPALAIPSCATTKEITTDGESRATAVLDGAQFASRRFSSCGVAPHLPVAEEVDDPVAHLSHRLRPHTA